jgi:hypothetical protein
MIIAFSGFSSAHAAVGSPVAQWVADDWTGGTANWVDRVGGKVATISAAANSPTKILGAIVGTETTSGIVFDGVDDFFAVAPAQNPIQGATSVTIAAFFNTTQGASGADGAFWRYPGPVNGEAPGWPNDWGLTYSSAGEAQGFFNYQINPSPAVSLIDGLPHTMILTWQTPELVARLYVDGVLVGSTNTSAAGGVNNANGLVFGAEMEGAILGFSSPRFFSGAIGELRFYNSIEDPATLHGEMLGALTTPATSLALPGNATLNGAGYPNGVATNAYFTYGTDPTLSTGTTDTALQAIGNGIAGVPVNQSLTGLALYTRYYFRLVITNTNGTLVGATQSFILGPEIGVEQPAGLSLVDGESTVNFGIGAVGFPTTRTFTVVNSGVLDLTSLSINVDGMNAGEFAVDALGATTVSPGASTTFDVIFTPGAAGTQSAEIHIVSNVVGSENPFDIALAGTAVAAPLGPNLANGELTGGLARPVQVAAYDGATVYNPNPGICGSSWQLVGTLCDEAPTTHSPTISTKTNANSGATYNNSSFSGTGVLVVDLGAVQTFNRVNVFQMFSDGKTTHFRISTHPESGATAPDWQDAGWTSVNGFDFIGPGVNLGRNQVGDPTLIALPTTSSRYVMVEMRNDGSHGNYYWIELRAFKLFFSSNLLPVANVGGPYLVAVGQDVAFDGSGSDDPDGGTLSETWTASGGTVTGDVYTAGAVPGIYDVQLIVNDGKENSQPATTMVVVYDPSGGFVTGGGWFDSPAGAYTTDPSLTGKANFGFVAKYQYGANVPDGDTQFQFRAGDLNFHSTSYEWLVVAGNKAQFRGEGTINGQGSYTFMIWADDDNPDTFRIKIWGANGTVYDNGSQQALGGGSIKIHN